MLLNHIELSTKRPNLVMYFWATVDNVLNTHSGPNAITVMIQGKQHLAKAIAQSGEAESWHGEVELIWRHIFCKYIVWNAFYWSLIKSPVRSHVVGRKIIILIFRWGNWGTETFSNSIASCIEEVVGPITFTMHDRLPPVMCWHMFKICLF